MSKIKNSGLNQYGGEPFEQHQFGTAGVEGVHLFLLRFLLMKFVIMPAVEASTCIARPTSYTGCKYCCTGIFLDKTGFWFDLIRDLSLNVFFCRSVVRHTYAVCVRLTSGLLQKEINKWYCSGLSSRQLSKLYHRHQRLHARLDLYITFKCAILLGKNTNINCCLSLFLTISWHHLLLICRIQNSCNSKLHWLVTSIVLCFTKFTVKNKRIIFIVKISIREMSLIYIKNYHNSIFNYIQWFGRILLFARIITWYRINSTQLTYFVLSWGHSTKRSLLNILQKIHIQKHGTVSKTRTIVSSSDHHSSAVSYHLSKCMLAAYYDLQHTVHKHNFDNWLHCFMFMHNCFTGFF